ncbi:TolC family protein [Flammeovirga agarivorans]|uniref:TolC family protein n=1 Tax=Flammeovirga agarivorans TaxID=2726742 RepID=A0A7X8XWA5_9BACT|nr:TolC family protein [Flammeovirga agarivorans]NLR92056.1 TolC family protein [Flammeovirga agarivorans]
MRSKNKLLLPLLILYGCWHTADAQTIITFEQAEKEAVEKHPITTQREMYERMHQAGIESISKDKLPKFNLQGKLGYFSDVISPSDPNSPAAVVFPEIPHTQWSAYASVDYNLYDGGIKKKKIADKEAEYGVQMQENTVSQFKIKESVSQVYFAALSYQEQEILIKDGIIKEIENRIKEMEALQSGGAALPNSTDALKVEYHKAKQKLLSVQAQKDGALRVLSIWLERESEWKEIELTRPEILNENSNEILRPELTMFSLQAQRMDATSDLLHSQRMPKVGLFALGGYGTPNPYNFFEVDGDVFYQVGFKVQWSPFDYGKNKKERQVTQIQKEVINAELESFNKNINIQVSQIQARINQLETMITEDHEIIKIQENRAKRTKGALENGAATSSQYVTNLNELTDAKLNLSNHELELLQTRYHLAMTKGLL